MPLDCTHDALCDCEECRHSHAHTQDKVPGKSIRFYTDEQLGEKQSLTPEGFLLCEDVPIARIGTQLYADGEIPVESGPDKIIRIHREEGEVFNPKAISSFNGKPFTNDHPPEMVIPANHAKYAKGVTMNPRRGDGAKLDNSFLYADLLVTDPDTIKAIRNGKRGISAGYDSEYEQKQPGEGRQFNITGNHVALVDKGRCGPTCSIGDSEMPGQRRNWKDRIMAAVRTHDEGAALSEIEKIGGMLGSSALDEEPDVGRTDANGHHIVVNLNGTGGSAAPAAKAQDEGADPAETGGDLQKAIEAALAPLMQRIDALEQAVVVLADEDDDGADDDFGEEDAPEDAGEGDDPEANDDPDATGDRRMSRDARRTHDRGRRTHDRGRRTRDARRTRDEGNEAAEEDRRQERRQEATGDQNPAKSENDVPEQPPGMGKGVTGDRRRATADSASLRVEFQETLSRAEILVPGSKLPTFDAAKPPAFTTDALCNFRRSVLEAAWKQPDTHDALAAMLPGGNGDFRKMTCDAATLVFNAASEMVRAKNNAVHVGASRLPTNAGAPAGFRSAADINKMNRERYGIK